MDRNQHSVGEQGDVEVASREGGVDRNRSNAEYVVTGRVASREGGVDRNTPTG